MRGGVKAEESAEVDSQLSQLERASRYLSS